MVKNDLPYSDMIVFILILMYQFGDLEAPIVNEKVLWTSNKECSFLQRIMFFDSEIVFTFLLHSYLLEIEVSHSYIH